MLMRLDLVLTTEAAGRMAIGEVAGLVGEDREDIKLPLYLILLKTHKIYS